MAYICGSCKHTFETPKKSRESHGDNYTFNEEWDVCPNCGSDDIGDACLCELCGKDISYQNIDNGLCSKCQPVAREEILGSLSKLPSAILAYAVEEGWIMI